MTEIFVSLIGGLCVAVPSVIATISTNNKNQALINYKIDQISKKVNEHNILVEKTYKLEERMSLIENDMEDIKGSKNWQQDIFGLS